jgi:hypothetical protein
MYTNSPYKNIPEELLNDYTLNGKIDICDVYCDNSVKNKIIWDEKLLDTYIKRNSESRVLNGKGCSNYGKDSILWILKAIQKYKISNKKVGVLGSTTPWIEALLTHFNNDIYTIEYNVPIIKSSKYKIYTKNYFDFEKETNNYDCIISYSSIEHSGLGRYGDPLNPNGDFETMTAIYNNLKTDGLLFLGIPIANDVIAWNAHREYGPIRYPLLIKNFEELEWIGISKDKLSDSSIRKGYSPYQPVIVLKK